MASEPPTIPPVAPPTLPVGIPPSARRSVWPTAIGIIGIILGVLGGMTALLGVLFEVFETDQTWGMPPATTPVSTSAGEKFAGAWIYGVDLIVAALLLTTSIGLVGRRAWSVRWLRAWAIVKIFSTIVGMAVTYGELESAIDEVMADSGNPAATRAAWGWVVPATATGYILWGWAWPVFILIWFRRERIREELGTWPRRRAASAHANARSS